MTRYVGVDLHRRRSVIVVLDSDGTELWTKRIDNDPLTLGLEIEKAGPTPEVVLEATWGWYWAADVISEAGGRVHLAHPLGIKGFENRRVKTDRVDARLLADLLRMGMLPESWIAPEDVRYQRELVRYRRKLSQLRAGLKAQVHAVLGKEGLMAPISHMWGPGGNAWLDETDMANAYETRETDHRDPRRRGAQEPSRDAFRTARPKLTSRSGRYWTIAWRRGARDVPSSGAPAKPQSGHPAIFWSRMTTPEFGYALSAGEAIEEWEIGGDVLRLLVSAQRSAGTVSVLEGLIHGVGPPLHVHDDEDEVVVVLEGSLAYRVGDGEGIVGAGDLLWMPRLVPHAIANGGVSPCRFLTMATPGGIEDLFRAQSRYLASLPPGAAPDPVEMGKLDGAEKRRVIGPPLEPVEERQIEYVGEGVGEMSATRSPSQRDSYGS